jgi:DNA-binding MarR family transcriptional regulator
MPTLEGKKRYNMEADVTLSKGTQLFSLLATTYNAMLRARKKELEPSGISFRRTTVLWCINIMARPTTVAEISQIIDRDHQATSQLLRRMERERLVERHKGAHDKSPITVVLTPKGKQALRSTFERYEMFDEIASCLSPEELENLLGYLKRLREKAIAQSALYPPLPAPLASKLGM